ncbi:glycosyltransferase family 4 protein [Nitrospira lenta]|uniref:Putative Glycosyl transferase group 1 n=1 Tax=Nitrospira lenta TaxID=1436998 RepID=A0A330L429_9BACT|nr:glycosyltransferase family 1 protein [Nitrospira lenta]SPP63652.1 putative Glycosyl transferase group 1 [Nitrospira lenta]
MRIAIDFTSFIPQMTGVDTYLKQLVWNLAKVDRINQYRIYHNYEDRRLFAEGLPPNVSHCPLSARPRSTRLIAQQMLLPVAVSSWGADVVHSPSFIIPYLRGAARHVVTVHDMTSFSHPHCHIALRRSWLYQRAVLASIMRADVVVVPSQATRRAVLEFLPDLQPDRIHVTVLGIGEEFRRCDPASVREVVTRLTLPEPYILYVGTVEPRKNLPALVEAYRRLVQAGVITEHLVLAGKLGWGYESLLKQIQVPALRGRVHLAGYVNQQDLPALYAGARLFVYPSFHEGFGFPPLEAMACGVPVVSTKSSSLAENLACAAELVAPDDLAGLADAMQRLLTDDALRAKRQEHGLEQARQYRWEHTARETMKSYHMAMDMARG